MDTFFQSALFGSLRELLSAEQGVYLVGGALRDALLNRPVHDVDFVVLNRDSRDTVRQMARRAANQLGGAYYMLDEERQTARVILEEGGAGQHGVCLDFALARADSLHGDLELRDFTINAMAADINQPDRLIDPLGGLTDLRARRLRACSECSFIDDPLRVLRGVRLANTLGFQLEENTRRWMTAAVGQLEQVSAERVRDELVRMLESPDAVVAVRVLDHLGVLQVILPETQSMKGVQQSAPHTLDVWEHSMAVLRELDRLYALLVEGGDDVGAERTDRNANLIHGTAWIGLGHFKQRFVEHYRTAITPNRDMRALLFFAALYHDIGKPETLTVEESGRTRFFGHDEASTRHAMSRAHTLAFSQAEIQRMAVIVREHMRVHHLSNDPHLPSRRAIYRFFKATGQAGVDVCLLSLADTLATWNVTLPQEKWQREIEICRMLLDAWWEHRDEMVSPARLLTGTDLMKLFDLQPSPLVGALLDELAEAQACGEVTDREQAEDFARKWLNGQNRSGR